MGVLDRWFWEIAGTVAIAAVVLLRIFSSRDSAEEPVPASAAPSAVAREAGPPPDSVGVTPPPAAARVTDDTIATVYECHVNGGFVFSDQRCGSGATRRDVHAPSRMDPQDTRILGQRISVPEADQRPDLGYAQAFAITAAQCSDIERARNAINARMREGYSAAEGEFLRERLRKLSDEYYGLHCRHFH